MPERDLGREGCTEHEDESDSKVVGGTVPRRLSWGLRIVSPAMRALTGGHRELTRVSK